MADNNEVKKTTFKGWITSGADQNVELINTLDELERQIASGKRAVAVDSGYMTEEEAAAMYAQETAEIDKNTAQSLSDNTNLMLTNGVINSFGLVSSVLMAGSEVVAAKNMFGAVAKGMGPQTITKTVSTAAGDVTETMTKNVGFGEALKGVGFKKIFSPVTTAEGASKLSRVATGVANAIKLPGAAVMSASKWLLTHGGVMTKLVGTGLPIAAAAAPAMLARIYTTGRTEDAADGYQQAINTCLTMHNSLMENGDQMREDMAEDFGKWDEAYTAATAEYYEQFDAGKISKEELDVALEDISKEYADQLKPLQEKYAKEGEQIIGPKLAGSAGEEITKKGYDLEEVENRSYEVRDTLEKNPEIREDIVDYQQKEAELDTGSSFTNFLASLNASILHYLPGASYVEAALIKGADVVMDFVANKVPVLSSVIDYDEKHKGESISELAKTISEDAEARYETEHAMKEHASNIEDTKNWGTVDVNGPEESGPEMAVSPA